MHDPSGPPDDDAAEPAARPAGPAMDDRLAAMAENLRAMHDRNGVPLPDEAIAAAPLLSLKLPPDDLANKIADILCVPDGRHGLFRFGDEIVVIDEQEGAIRKMTGRAFRTWLPSMRGVFPVKGWRDEELADGSKVKKPVKGGLTKDQAETTLEAAVLRENLPLLQRIHKVRLPHIPYDENGVGGELRLLKPGFDPATGIFTCRGGLDYATDMDFDEAVSYFHELFRWFGWRFPERDFAIHLAAIMTMFGRGIYLGKAPAFWWNANIQESGKTTLASYVTWLVHGTQHTRTLLQDAEEKLQDTLDTVARGGSPYIFFDNVDWGNQPVKTVLLDEWLTNSEHAFRLKGGHTDVDVKLHCMTLGTGNGVTLSTDLQRRSLMIDILNRVTGAERQLPPNVQLLDSAFFASSENRKKGLAAAWALLRDWDDSGRPARPGRLLGSFEQWTKVIPSIVYHAGKKGGNMTWDCMVESSNEDIGDKESKEFKRLAELALAEFGKDLTTGGMRDAFEISVAQFAGVARRNAVATRSLFPENDIESVMQTEKKAGGWTFVPPTASQSARMDANAPLGVDLEEEEDEFDRMVNETEGTPRTREYSASEWMSPKSRSAFGNACKARFHERYFAGPDGQQYEFAHRRNVTPARYAITRVKR